MATLDKYKGQPFASAIVRNAGHMLDVVLSRYLGRQPRYLPIMLMFMSWRCNLRCPMCGVKESETQCAAQEELTTEQWKAVIASAATNLGTSLVSISGGEPLLRKDIYEIIRFATDAGMAVHICTNAVLLGVTEAEKLRDAGIATVSISLDSTEASAHDYLRGAGAFEAVVQAIRVLRETAPDVRIGINFLITRRNYKQMIEMLSFAERLDVHQIKFAPIHTNLLHRNKALENYGDLLFLPDDLEDLEREVQHLRRRCAASRLTTTSDAFFPGISRLYRDPIPFRCYAGYAVCAVGPDGQVSPCCDMDSTFSVKENSLDQIWRMPEFHQLRKQVHRCEAACWDTTNTDLSLRLRPLGMVREVLHNWRSLKFYLGSKK